MMKGWKVEGFHNNRSGRLPEISRSKQRKKLKMKNERSENNLIIIGYSDFYKILHISLYNYLSRNITRVLIKINLL